MHFHQLYATQTNFKVPLISAANPTVTLPAQDWAFSSPPLGLMRTRFTCAAQVFPSAACKGLCFPPQLQKMDKYIIH